MEETRVIFGNSVGNYPVKPPRRGRWRPTIHTYWQVYLFFVLFCRQPVQLEPSEWLSFWLVTSNNSDSEPVWQRYVAGRWDNLATVWAIRAPRFGRVCLLSGTRMAHKDGIHCIWFTFGHVPPYSRIFIRRGLRLAVLLGSKLPWNSSHLSLDPGHGVWWKNVPKVSPSQFLFLNTNMAYHTTTVPPADAATSVKHAPVLRPCCLSNAW